MQRVAIDISTVWDSQIDMHFNPTHATVDYRQEIYHKHSFANLSRTPERSLTQSFTATTVLSLFHM